MREAVIVSTARTPIGKAYRGASSTTPRLRSAATRSSMRSSALGIEPGEIDDVVMGAAMQQGSTSMNVARQAAAARGPADLVAGMSVDRQCASGLMADRHRREGDHRDGMSVTIGGGLESISLVQNDTLTVTALKIPGSSSTVTTST